MPGRRQDKSAPVILKSVSDEGTAFADMRLYKNRSISAVDSSQAQNDRMKILTAGMHSACCQSGGQYNNAYSIPRGMAKHIRNLQKMFFS